MEHHSRLIRCVQLPFSPWPVSSLLCAQWCLEALLLKFGNGGLRMSRLLALHCEYHQRWEEAVEAYEKVLQSDATNIVAYKRLIAVAKARGKIDEAIERLVKYTKTFAADEAGWLDLCDLYVQQQQMDFAAFCMEECILATPENHQYHTRYAEVTSTPHIALAQQSRAQSLLPLPSPSLTSPLVALVCLCPSCCTPVVALSWLDSTSHRRWS